MKKKRKQPKPQPNPIRLPAWAFRTHLTPRSHPAHKARLRQIIWALPQRGKNEA